MYKIILFFIVSFGLSCHFSDYRRLEGYDLQKPDENMVLPAELHEISGITTLDEKTLGCIQDENGVLFFLDADSKKISRELVFGGDGDYEGIARAGKSVYILRSDGNLFEIPDFRMEESETRYHVTNVPAMNNEGLCYDKDNSRLLIGCKGKIEKGPAYKDRRFIYAFDLKTGQPGTSPVFEFNAAEITRFAVKNGIVPATKENKKGKTINNQIRLNTSEIAIHPITKELFLLSASDHMLMVFNLRGEIQHIEKLDPLLFNKPEGIAFYNNGDMLITNEGQQKEPKILRFNFSKH